MAAGMETHPDPAVGRTNMKPTAQCWRGCVDPLHATAPRSPPAGSASLLALFSVTDGDRALSRACHEALTSQGGEP